MPVPQGAGRKSPVVDGRARHRRGSTWTADLFSTRGEYTSGLLYKSRLLQLREDGSQATQRLEELQRKQRLALESHGDDSGDDSSSDDNSDSESRGVIRVHRKNSDSGVKMRPQMRGYRDKLLKKDRSQRLIKSVKTEAMRDYMLALRSAVENPNLHERILNTKFLKTLCRLKKLSEPTVKSQRSSKSKNKNGDLVLAALCSEVLSYMCHSPHDEVKLNLLKEGATKMLIQFASDAVKFTQGYSARTLQLLCISASALTSLSTLKYAPAKFGRASVFSHMQSWIRTTRGNLHMRESYINILMNIADSTPKSHPTFWLDQLIYSVCDEFVKYDGRDSACRNICLRVACTLVRTIEVSGAANRITKGGHDIISHCFKLLNNTESIWKIDTRREWYALVQAIASIAYIISCSSKATGNVCDPGEQPVLPLINKLVQIGFREQEIQNDLHCCCVSIIGNIARIERLRGMLLDGCVTQILHEIIESAVHLDKPWNITQCVVTMQTLVSDENSNIKVAIQGGLQTLIQAFTYANNFAAYGISETNSIVSSEHSRVEKLSSVCICGIMSCSDIGKLIDAIGEDVQTTLLEMLKHRDSLLKRHPSLLGPFVTMIRNISCVPKGLAIYGKLRNMAKTLMGMSKLVPNPPFVTKFRDGKKKATFMEKLEKRDIQYAKREHTQVTQPAAADNLQQLDATSQDDSDNEELMTNVEEEKNQPTFSSLRVTKKRWHPVWGPEIEGKACGRRKEDKHLDTAGNDGQSLEAMELEHMRIRISIAATLFNMATLKRCCTRQIAKPHVVRYLLGIIKGDNGDGTWHIRDAKKRKRMRRVQELTVATLLEISRIFKSAGQSFSELGVIDILVQLTTEQIVGQSSREVGGSIDLNPGQSDTHDGSMYSSHLSQERTVSNLPYQHPDNEERAAANTVVLAVSTMCALTALQCNAEVLIRHKVPKALLLAGSRASSMLAVRLRCAIALNNLVYHMPSIFTKEILIVAKDRRQHRRGGMLMSSEMKLNTESLQSPTSARAHSTKLPELHARVTSSLAPKVPVDSSQNIIKMPGRYSVTKNSSKRKEGTSSRQQSQSAKLLLTMLGDVNTQVRLFTTKAVCHLIQREHSSHKWLIRSGAVHELLLTGLLRSSRDEQPLRLIACQGMIELCIKAGRKWLRRRPFTSPHVVWAGTCMLRDGDYHQSDLKQSFADSGTLRECGIILLLYISATPQGRVLVGNGTTVECIVQIAFSCVHAKKRGGPPNAINLLNCCVKTLVNLCCGIGSGVLQTPRDPDTNKARRLDDDGSLQAYKSERQRRKFIFSQISNKGLVEKIVTLTREVRQEHLKVELGSVVAALIMSDEVSYEDVEVSGSISLLLELTHIDPGAQNSSVDVGHWMALQEHAAMVAFHISELSRVSRDYMIREAKNGAIELALIPIQSNPFTNRVKDLCIRALETFAREPSLRPLLIEHGLLRFSEDLLKQHQGPKLLHRRAMILCRTLRLVTRRFPRSSLHVHNKKCDDSPTDDIQDTIQANDKEDFFAALVQRQDGIVVDKVAEEKYRRQRLQNADKGVWHTLASKGIIKLLLIMANSKGDKQRAIHFDCARTLCNITEDAEACLQIAKLPGARDRFLELADILVDSEIENSIRSGSGSNAFSSVRMTAVDHMTYALSNLLGVRSSRMAFLENDALLTLEAFCISPAATESSVKAASKTLLALVTDGEGTRTMGKLSLRDRVCTEFVETEGFRNIRSMFEEVRSSGISLVGSRFLALTIWKLVEWCRNARLVILSSGKSSEQESKDEADWRALLSVAENDLLKCTEGNEEKLKGLMAPDEPKTLLDAARPICISSEDDESRGSNDLGKLLGNMSHGKGGAFVAKFTRVVNWPVVNFSTLPDVPQGMRLDTKPGVVERWQVANLLTSNKPAKGNDRDLPATTGDEQGENYENENDAVAHDGHDLKPILGFRGVVLSNICESTYEIFKESRSLGMREVQKLAQQTNREEIQRQLKISELELIHEAREKRFLEEQQNRKQLEILDKQATKEFLATLQLRKEVSSMASEAVAYVAQKSTSLVRLKAKRDEIRDAHRRSLIRLKNLEETVAKDVKSKSAIDFIEKMRAKGEQTKAKTQRKVVRELGRLLL